MFDWYLELSRWQKVGASLLVLGASGVMWMLGSFWPWGWAIGVIMFVGAFLFDDD